MIGWRVPSEICEMTTNDVILNGDGTGCIVITEPKKTPVTENSISKKTNS